LSHGDPENPSSTCTTGQKNSWTKNPIVSEMLHVLAQQKFAFLSFSDKRNGRSRFSRRRYLEFVKCGLKLVLCCLNAF
jgi:hypothetical protein